MNFKVFQKLVLTISGQRPRFCPAPVGVVAQLVERLNGIQEVRGSNPLGSTILRPQRSGERRMVSSVALAKEDGLTHPQGALGYGWQATFQSGVFAYRYSHSPIKTGLP